MTITQTPSHANHHSTRSRADSVARLINNWSAHIVLCDGKRGRRGWNKRGASAAEAERHILRGGAVGIIPDSIGLTCLDWDSDIAAAARFLSMHHTPLTIPTPRGWHMYFDDMDTPSAEGGNRRNSTWAWEGKPRGDVRGATGYVVLHHNAAQMLEAYLSKTRFANARMTPYAEVLRNIVVSSGFTQETDASDCADSHETGSSSTTAPADTEIALLRDFRWESVRVGQRNNTIFYRLTASARDECQRRIYDHADGMAAFVETLWKRAHGWAARIPDRTDFPDAEVDGIVKSVAGWWWARRRGIQIRCADSETQARRGRMSGAARRWAQRERDQLIRRLRMLDHKSYRAIGAQLSVAASTAWRVCQRTRAQLRRLEREGRLEREAHGETASGASGHRVFEADFQSNATDAHQPLTGSRNGLPVTAPAHSAELAHSAQHVAIATRRTAIAPGSG